MTNQISMARNVRMKPKLTLKTKTMGIVMTVCVL